MSFIPASLSGKTRQVLGFQVPVAILKWGAEVVSATHRTPLPLGPHPPAGWPPLPGPHLVVGGPPVVTTGAQEKAKR